MTTYKNLHYDDLINKFRHDNKKRIDHYSSFEVERRQLQKKALLFAG